MDIKSDRNCPYCNLIKDDSKAYIIFKDVLVTAFLSHMPVNIGHAIIIPNNHYLNSSALPESVGGRMYYIASRIGVACKRILNSDGYNILSCDGFCSGQDIQHAAIQVIPRYLDDGWNLNWRTLGKPNLNETLKKILIKFNSFDLHQAEDCVELSK